MPVCDRVHYVTQTLEFWQRVRGIGDAHMILRLEPGFPDMEDLVYRMPPGAPGSEVIINAERLGNDQNMKAAVEAGFATGADFVIAAEDDVLVAADLLEYMTWAGQRYADDPSVLAVTAWQDTHPGALDGVRRVEWFYGGACWGMWRDRWDAVKDGWPPSGGGYDGYLWERCHGGVTCIQPLATRCSNIGEYGVNTRGEAHGFADVWARQQFTPDIGPQSYREEPGVWSADGKARLR